MWRAGIAGIAVALTALPSAAGDAPDADAWAETRTQFASAMGAITSAADDVVVTSKQRSDADQQRLIEQGYKPHARSQHKLGLAWDIAAPLETLTALRDLAQAQGFTALIMTSPVTGNAYLHVQRYRRSPVEAPPEPTPMVVAEAPSADEHEELVPVAALDPPRPVAGTRLDLPRRLLRKKVDGRIVLLLQVSEEGRVLDVAVDSSDLPEFDTFVTDEVRRWSFHPPQREGRPVLATARLPIPIRVE